MEQLSSGVADNEQGVTSLGREKVWIQGAYDQAIHGPILVGLRSECESIEEQILRLPLSHGFSRGTEFSHQY